MSKSGLLWQADKVLGSKPRCTSIPSRRSRNTSINILLHAMETGVKYWQLWARRPLPPLKGHCHGHFLTFSVKRHQNYD